MRRNLMQRDSSNVWKTCFALWLCVCAALPLHAAQQDKRPSDALRQVNNQQRKLAEEAARKFTEARRKGAPTSAQTEEREAMQETVRQVAIQRAAPFKASDWKGEEVLALIQLYQLGEQYPQTIEACRLFLKEPSDLETISNVRLTLLRALIETGRIDEAVKSLNETRAFFTGRNDFSLPARIGAYKSLAEVLRARGQSEDALRFARDAYGYAQGMLAEETRWRESVEPLRASLAALIVVLLEQSGKQKEAGEFHQRVLKEDFDAPSPARDAYQAELRATRLIGTAAPELTAARWLENGPLKLSDLRGKVVLLDFWAMWCAPCVAAFPHYRKLQSDYAAQGFQVIGVTRFFGRSDEKDDLNREQEWQALQAFKRKHQLNYPLVAGKLDDVADEERYGVTGLPTAILIDRQGRVRELRRGGGNYRQLARRVARLLEEK